MTSSEVALWDCIHALQDDNGRGCAGCGNDTRYHEHDCPKGAAVEGAYLALGVTPPQLWTVTWFTCSGCGLRDCYPKNAPTDVCSGCRSSEVSELQKV